MKAIVRDRYGSPDLLELGEVDVPAVGDDGVLVRVRAASVNAMDWHLLRGEPFPARIGNGFRRPTSKLLGSDVAGVVEAVGPDVTEFRPGDEVFGMRSGTFAEFVRGRSRNFAPKPRALSFEEAAAVPLAAETALQGLRDRGRLHSGQRVLVNGASGGVGTFAIQIARALGAEVTAVSSGGNADLVHSLGADHVIDYGREDFTRSQARYDLILDIAGTRPLRRCRRVLRPGGRLVVVGGPSGRWLAPMQRSIRAVLMSPFGSAKLVPFLAEHRKADLVAIAAMIDEGTVRPVIDRAYPLAEVAEAIRYVEAGHARGKVVITV